METLIRSLWLVRAWTGGVLVGAAVLLAAVVPSAPTAAGLVLAVATEAVALVAHAAFSAALRDGGRGEVLLRAGVRVPLATMRRVHAADTAEATVGVAVVLLGLGPVVLAGTTTAALALGCASLLTVLQLGVLYRQRRWGHALVEALVALLAYDLDRADRLLRRVDRATAAAFRGPADGLRAHLLLVRGERDAALRSMEGAWDGTLDDHAATLGLLRLGAGDPSLAERYLAATRAPATRYERYLVALVEGHLALHGSRWEDAIASAARPVDVPEPYVRQLALVTAAGLQGAGRTEEARATLAAIRPGLERDAWRGRAHPAHWRLLEDAAAGRVTTALPPPVPVERLTPGGPPVVGHVFAAPEAVPVARRRRRATGAIPVEGMVLAERRPPALTAVALATTLLLVVLSGLTVTLLLVVTAVGSGDDVRLLRIASALGPVGLALGAATLAEPGIAWSSGRERPAVVLCDGRRVALRWFGPWSVSMVVPQLGWAAMLILLLGFLEGLGGRERWMYLVGLPFGVLYLWWAWRRWSAARLVRALHVLPATQAVAVAERSWRRVLPGQAHGLAWLALARLWTGDEAGAARDAREAAIVHPELGWIEGWLRAGRGEVDLERVLAEPDPSTLGDRYRRAVTIALAALRARAAGRVADRLDDWTDVAEQLPNRFGALLWRLVIAVRRANGHAVEPAADPDLAWVARVWPFVE